MGHNSAFILLYLFIFNYYWSLSELYMTWLKSQLYFILTVITRNSFPHLYNRAVILLSGGSHFQSVLLAGYFGIYVLGAI